MSAIADRLQALLATATPADASIGQRILSDLQAKEAAVVASRSSHEVDQTAYNAALAAFEAARLVAFNQASRAIRAAENSVLLSRVSGFVATPDIACPADFAPPSGFASLTLLGLVEITALGAGAYGTTIEAQIAPLPGGGFGCNVRRGAFFQESLTIAPPSAGRIAKVRQIAPGALSATGWSSLSGAVGGGDVSLQARMRAFPNNDISSAVSIAGAQLAGLKRPSPPLARQASGSVSSAEAAVAPAAARAQQFSDYLEFS